VARKPRARAFSFLWLRDVLRKKKSKSTVVDGRDLQRRGGVADEHRFEANLLEAAADFARQRSGIDATSIEERFRGAFCLLAREPASA
jgi:hypothetical protein